MSKRIDWWPRPWGAPRKSAAAPRVTARPQAVSGPAPDAGVPCPRRPRPAYRPLTAEQVAQLPSDRRDVLELAAAVMCTQLSRGFGPAIELSDLFAQARIALPLLNWPLAALQPLEQIRDRRELSAAVQP